MDNTPHSQTIDKTPLPLGKQTKRKNRFIIKLKRKLFKHVWVIRTSLVLGFIALVYLVVLFIGLILKTTGADFYLSLASDFIFAPVEKMQSNDSKTNILILGKGGEGHEAPELTDTMMFVSVNHTRSKIVMISLPRDIWIPELRAKLNSAYYWGNKKQAGGGIVLAESAVEEVLGQPVHYSVVVDFTVFEKIIDEIGGIEVDVKNAFVDNKYPIKGRENDDCNGDVSLMCRYETIVFEKGVKHMDGALALKYVRSRNADGDEGTDFARSLRQQAIIKSIEEKVLSKEILLSPKKIRSLIDIVTYHTQTTLDPSALAILARRIYEAQDDMSTNVIPEDLLINPQISPDYDNLYVFTPRIITEDGKFVWNEVHTWADCQINENCNLTHNW
ncbi:LCP family protein [Candidatus Woesebacteria bacterium]|nr:MAG: LCP family protein [Candidatus Woesebacteria bacterium]